MRQASSRLWRIAPFIKHDDSLTVCVMGDASERKGAEMERNVRKVDHEAANNPRYESGPKYSLPA
jgi:hypothetical protein